MLPCLQGPWGELHPSEPQVPHKPHIMSAVLWVSKAIIDKSQPCNPPAPKSQYYHSRHLEPPIEKKKHFFIFTSIMNDVYDPPVSGLAVVTSD